MTFAGLTPGKYGMIEADPPWRWMNWSGRGSAPHRTADEPYPTMSYDDLKALPVADLAARDCLLHMWTIGSHLEMALGLGREWGFTFKTDGFMWVKSLPGRPNHRPISMGKWVRKQVEYGLIFTRGKPSRLNADVRQLFEDNDEQVIYAPRGRHSVKPAERYERIERLVDGPYCELFARNRRDGWDSWGNELPPLQGDPTVAALIGGSLRHISDVRTVTAQDNDLIG